MGRETITKDQALKEALQLCETLPIQTVARVLAAEHPGWFKNTDAARCALRYRRGARGDRLRSHANITEPKLSSIAEGVEKLKRHQKVREQPIHISDCKALVISDLHIPYHELSAVTLALETGKRENVDTIILNGDIVDCYMVSRWTKESGRMSLKQELDVTKGFLELVRREFPDARIVYKFGNHERRLRDYILHNADKLAELDVLDLESLLELDNLGIEHIKMERICLGHLNVIHGDELPHGFAAPVNPARGVFLRSKKSTLVGHHHQTSHHSEGDIEGGRTGCWSIGCLCDLSPDYYYFGALKWNHGFAIVDVDEEGQFTVYNKSIINGKVH